jgi:hypothetical protein
MTVACAGFAAIVGAVLIGPSAVSQSPAPSETACAVTTNNGRGLLRGPGELPAGNHSNDNRTIATSLWPGGTVTFKPGGSGCVEDDGSLWMKFPWWHKGKRKRLVIEGHRLDGDAPPLRARLAGYSGEFQASGLIFPTPGCWEVTGKVDDQTLTFVVRVIKIGNGPNRCKNRATRSPKASRP